MKFQKISPMATTTTLEKEPCVTLHVGDVDENSNDDASPNMKPNASQPARRFSAI